MIDSYLADDIARVLIEDYLLDGPGYADIKDAVRSETSVADELLDDEDVDVVASIVRATLTNLAKNFSLA